MEELIKRFNINIVRIRRANKFYRAHEGNSKTDQELSNIIMDCNDICNKLLAHGFDINTLNMDIT